jgi:hypothetical protein
MGLIGRPGMAAVEAGNRRSCSLDFRFSKTALEEPFTTAEGIYNGLDRQARDGRR